MKTSVTLVQFTNVWKSKYWEPELNRMYFVGSQNAREEFEDTFEDDDGNDVEDIVTKRCLVIYASYQDYLIGDEAACIPKDDSEYTLMKVNIIMDEDNNQITGLAI